MDLKRTLAWTKAHHGTSPNAAEELAMLNDLQGNILKGHGRHFTSNIFLKFDKKKSSATRKFLASIGHDTTAALDQLIGATSHKTHGIDAGTFISVFISAAGYDALEKADAKPKSRAFLDGMHKRDLNDPPSSEWADSFKEMHGMLLVATSSPEWRDKERDALLARIKATSGAVQVHGETLEGDALFNKKDKRGIEHFGYVDGRSQPLVLQEDIDREAANAPTQPQPHWDPTIFLDQLLVPCPGGRLGVSFGSYFVIRKLEQRVKDFKEAEEALGESLDAEAAQGGSQEKVGERAGASVVGRFENGTPVTYSKEQVELTAPNDDAIKNQFDYSNDKQGLKCPFVAHIRKTNPRADTPDSKSHLMARRGIPYGHRDDHPNDDVSEKTPNAGVGLIFMAYQADLENQFEFIQSSWANNSNFARPLVTPGPETGIDPVIGQGPDGDPVQLYPLEWDVKLSSISRDFSGFVEMKGGEYLFAPSISFLKSLH